MKKEDNFPSFAATIFVVLLILALGIGDGLLLASSNGYLYQKVATEAKWHAVLIFGYIFTILFVAGAEASKAVSSFIVFGGFALVVYLSYLSCMRI